MRLLLLSAGMCLCLTGCYTMIYPPMDETGYGDGVGGQVVIVPDSLAGKGVVIINQNQVIVDRYYQDPFYQRSGLFGGFGYWDPYYYNPRGYYHDRHWRHGCHDYSPGTPSPQPKKPRRDEDYRGSEAPPPDAPNPNGGSTGAVPASASPPVLAQAPQPVQAQSATQDPSKKEVTNPDDSGRSLRSVQPPDPSGPHNSTDGQKDDAKSRRGNVRER